MRFALEGRCGKDPWLDSMMNPSFLPVIAKHSRWLLLWSCLIFSRQCLAAGPVPGQLVSWGDLGVSYLEPGSKISAIAAAHDHNLAMTTDGAVVAWGNNYDLQSTVP